MAKRPSIGAAMRQDDRIATRHLDAPSHVASVTERAPTRVGKVNISAYFPPEVKSSLRLVQAQNGRKIQDLLAEALNLLFAKYGVPESAPIADSRSRTDH